MNIEVKQIEQFWEGTTVPRPKPIWGLFVEGKLLGTSKNRFDADHGKAILEGSLVRITNVLDAPPIQDDPTVQKYPEPWSYTNQKTPFVPDGQCL